jgi:hypothetical protein
LLGSGLAKTLESDADAYGKYLEVTGIKEIKDTKGNQGQNGTSLHFAGQTKNGLTRLVSSGRSSESSTPMFQFNDFSKSEFELPRP